MRPAPPVHESSYAASPTLRSAWRASRLALVIGLVIVLAAILGVLLAPSGGPTRALDPDGTSMNGAKALAELLRDRGVEVKKVDSAEAAAANAAQGPTLLLITDMLYVDEDTLAEIPGDRLIIGDQLGLDVLAPGVSTVGEPVRERSREPECDLEAARVAGSAFIGDTAFKGPSGSRGCYPAGDGHALVTFQEGGRTITMVGSGTFMTNGYLAEDGNAALALNLIGTGRSVTWLVRPEAPPPDLVLEPGDKSVYDLMPGSLRWAIYMTIITVLLLAFWRGRRLGPVVTERLPVIVRAAETVEGRGRLYRARRARAKAAEKLRSGTVDRLTPRLGLGSGAGRHEVVSALSVRIGHDPQQVGAALYGPPPADDAGLVALAGYLDFIERQVSEL
ncbi:DUF4350 domain-containing protein [Nonomuraea sp. NN258]|nr:DUF4350 domain-containing protein [Nonomuraea antri]